MIRSEKQGSGRAPARARPALLDRLVTFGTAPNGRELLDHSATVAQMRNTLLGELILLLNSTNHGEHTAIARGAAVSSVLNYGLPSVAGKSAGHQRLRDIAELVRRAIVDFEPRLDPNSVQVNPVPMEPALDRPDSLCLEIEALIPMSPYPVEFAARGMLDLETCRMNVRLIQDGGDPS